MKYNAKAVEVDWIRFDSTIEADYYRENKDRIELIHPRYIIQPEFAKNGKKFKSVSYVADFELDDWTVIDIKGMATETAMLKRKMFEYAFPEKTLIRLCFSKKRGGRVEYDKLIKLRKHAKLLQSDN